ncbi:hypothetical protein HUG10_08330 [Halorarum halophilum]|uniref:Uncharacterized protein n=1 Tax=Halorarum halophilum TaxID=2743090 RepID=A0A7D5KDP0_9EURY|nr:hypothetical protein [Halobaculum halophilum]QLG27557.1 hypothetical protein HUG10_08330 [Halobaculum halophilum]
MNRQDVLLGAVGVGGLLVGAGCAADVGDDAERTAGDGTVRAANPPVTSVTGADGNTSTAPATGVRSNARTGRPTSVRTPTSGRTPPTAPTPTGTSQSTTVSTGTPRTTRSQVSSDVSTPGDAPPAPKTPSPTDPRTSTSTRQETATPTETTVPTGTRETPTPAPTPSRPPRQGVFARYDRNDQSGVDAVRFRIDNANTSDVRVELSVTWWHADGSILSERRASELGPLGTWEGEVAHSAGDVRVNRWDASIESVTWA